MARLCGVTLSGYRKWEQRGIVGLKSLFAIKEAIRTVCPELPEFDMLRIQEPDFPAWLAAQLAGRKAEGLSFSERSLDGLIGDQALWQSLGGNAALGYALREKLRDYRSDLDKADWVDVIRMIQAGRQAEEEWKFADPAVLSRKMRFKTTAGTILTDAQWAKIERIAQEEVDRLQRAEREKNRNSE